MDERQRMEELQDTDFKYVMQDTGNIYIGARLTYAELMDQEMLPSSDLTWKRAAFYMKPLHSFGSK
ncbi:hypothetical protein [Suilimivivens sp.]|uniref:hypothetical protein n=1 Tax=Suilimivivens sp. TaxID=2981669 RepID=UPI003077388B